MTPSSWIWNNRSKVSRSGCHVTCRLIWVKWAEVIYQERSMFSQQTIQRATARTAVQPQHHRVSRRVHLRLYKPENVTTGKNDGQVKPQLTSLRTKRFSIMTAVNGQTSEWAVHLLRAQYSDGPWRNHTASLTWRCHFVAPHRRSELLLKSFKADEIGLFSFY